MPVVGLLLVGESFPKGGNPNMCIQVIEKWVEVNNQTLGY